MNCFLTVALLTALGNTLGHKHFVPVVNVFENRPLGVLRHTIRALETIHREQEATTSPGHGLLLSAAVPTSQIGL